MTMKIKSIAAVLAAAVILSACAETVNDTHKDINWDISGDYLTLFSCEYMVNETPKELVDAADMVFIGKVKSLSFEILDWETGLPPTEQTEEKNKKLYTNYTVEVITSYKGDVSGTFTFKEYGGVRDRYIDEQIIALTEVKEHPTISDILVAERENYIIEEGHIYLFSLYKLNDGSFTLLTPDTQSAFPVENVEEKDQFGCISAKDVISYFGEDKWNEFNASNISETE